MIGKIFAGIVVLIIWFLIGTPATAVGIHNWQTDEVTQATVVTTSGGTTADIVLNNDLFRDTTSQVVSVASSESSSETPVATSYTSATKTLTISALDSGTTTRTITIVYYAPVNDAIMNAVGPFLNVLVNLGVVGLVFWGVFGTGGRKGRRA